MAIMSSHKMNWCQMMFYKLCEEKQKPYNGRKSFSLVLDYILTHFRIQQSPSAKKILAEKFLGGTKPTLNNKETPIENRPDPEYVPKSIDSRNII